MTIPRNPHDPYIQATVDAMTALDAAPANWWVSDAETASDGETMTLTAVLTWDSDDSYGTLLCWSLEQGWQQADMKADGSNTPPEDLPLPIWAHPQDVAEAARALLAGEPVLRGTRAYWPDAQVRADVKAWVES